MLIEIIDATRSLVNLLKNHLDDLAEDYVKYSIINGIVASNHKKAWLVIAPLYLLTNKISDEIGNYLENFKDIFVSQIGLNFLISDSLKENIYNKEKIWYVSAINDIAEDSVKSICIYSTFKLSNLIQTSVNSHSTAMSIFVKYMQITSLSNTYNLADEVADYIGDCTQYYLFDYLDGNIFDL